MDDVSNTPLPIGKILHNVFEGFGRKRVLGFRALGFRVLR
jgi:hypothetical protein